MFVDFITSLAKRAGDLAEAERLKLRQCDVEFKNPRDIVTAADKAVENFIISEIRSAWPSHDILAEESGSHRAGGEYCWCVDPIDGTASFFHGQPFYSVSIALMKDGRSVAAAVCAPRLGELYWAGEGRGAFLNGEPIHVSRTDRLVNSCLSTGFACVRAGLSPNNLVYFCRIVPEVREIRRYGSAAIDLCYVACGRLDGYWEMNLNLYDIAAGMLIASEAGGRVCDFKGGGDYPAKGLVATNGLVAEELLGLLR